MKLELGIHISLYINCVFYSGRIKTLVAMATYIFHRLIMVKVNIDNFFCFNGDIWNLFLQNCFVELPSKSHMAFVQIPEFH